MPKPAVWNDEPECGHEVTCAYQTHYCTYIRVPRLLGLQSSPGDSTLVVAHQWLELWFKVLLTDLRALAADDGATYEPVKLLRRGSELFKLLDAHFELCASLFGRVAQSQPAVRAETVTAVSAQWAQITALARRLPRWTKHARPEVAEAARDYAARLRALRPRYQKFLRATLAPRPARAPAYAYAAWFRLPELLSLQDGVRADWAEMGRLPTTLWKPDHLHPDEMMFVIVHQCFEVWFKVILEHIDRATPLLLAGDVPGAHRLVRRVAAIQKLLVQQIQIPATMLPLDFLRFREMRETRAGKTYRTGLSPASGTESYQFREIEIVCGLRDDAAFRTYLAGTDKLPIRLLTPKQAERLTQPTLPEAFRAAVAQRGITDYVALYTPADVPNPNADLAALGDALLEFDEFFRFWRLGHVSMVEKMIGAKSGTGFLGPEYLMETAGIKLQEHNRIFAERQVRPRFFEDLWAARSRLGAY